MSPGLWILKVLMIEKMSITCWAFRYSRTLNIVQNVPVLPKPSLERERERKREGGREREKLDHYLRYFMIQNIHRD